MISIFRVGLWCDERLQAFTLEERPHCERQVIWYCNKPCVACWSLYSGWVYGVTSAYRHSLISSSHLSPTCPRGTRTPSKKNRRSHNASAMLGRRRWRRPNSAEALCERIRVSWDVILPAQLKPIKKSCAAVLIWFDKIRTQLATHKLLFCIPQTTTISCVETGRRLRQYPAVSGRICDIAFLVYLYATWGLTPTLAGTCRDVNVCTGSGMRSVGRLN